MAFFPRIFQNEFAQVARLMDEVASFQAMNPSLFYPTFASNGAGNARPFQQPRFDIKENKDSYELSGELPGYTDVNVEFTDASTLRIKGRSEHTREEGTRPAQLTGARQQGMITEGDNEAGNNTTTTEQETGDNNNNDGQHHYRKPSVEDENWVDASKTEESATNTATTTTADASASAPSSSTQVATTSAAQEVTPPARSSEPRYWLSERSVGEFTRTFTFPSRVNQDAVKASMKNGILSVIVPKAQNVTRRINIE